MAPEASWSAGPRLMRSYRTALRRLALVIGGRALVVLTLPLIGPQPAGNMGVTFCYPVLGPIQHFNPDLSDSLLARVRAHEQAHADQCRRDGAFWHYIRRMTTRQRLSSEAEGYCAEVRLGIANGGTARLVYAGALDELWETPWFHRVSTAALAAALASQCPVIAAEAARQEAEWQARLRKRRARYRRRKGRTHRNPSMLRL